MKSTMNILIILLSLLIISLSLISCSNNKKNSNNTENLNYTKEILNGITTIINENKPSQSTLEIELEKVSEIVGLNEESGDSTLFARANDIQMDNIGNLYILEAQKSHIYKYSKKGELISRFGRSGKGPGEFSNVYSFFVSNGSIFIPEFSSRRISKFDVKGNFSEYKLFDDMNIPSNLKKFGSGKLIGSQGLGFSFENGVWKNRISLEIYDNSLDIIKQVFEYEDELDFSKTFNPLNIQIPLGCTDDEIFISENDDDNYQINVLDKLGKKNREIKKKYRKIRRTKEERKEFQTSNSYNFGVNGEMKRLKADAEFKKAIATIDIDKNNRIWVGISSEKKDNLEGAWYDIFSSEGIFLNRVKLEVDKDVEIYFLEDKIISYHRENNIVKVYDY